MNIKKLKENIDIGVSLATIIGSIVTPLGLIYTVNEYISQQRTWREEKTLDLYKKQLEDPLLNNRIKLDVLYDPKWRKQYLEAVKETNSDNRKPFENFSDKFSQDKSKEILTLTNFYEGIVNCVNTKICDEKTTRDLFEKDIREFVVLFGPFFCDLRQELKDEEIASKLVEFSKKPSQKILWKSPWRLATKSQVKDTQTDSDNLCPENNGHSVAERGEVFQK